MVEFGERVMYYKSGITGTQKLESRWESGIWLGLRDETNEAIIGTPDGCIKARDVRRYGSEEEKWDQDKFMSMSGVPWEPIPGMKSCESRVKIAVPGWQKTSGKEWKVTKDLTWPEGSGLNPLTSR